MIVQNSKFFKVSLGKQEFFGFYKVPYYSSSWNSSINDMREYITL